MVLENDSSDRKLQQLTSKNQKVLIQDKICPPKAFQQGKSMTATQFIMKQQAEEFEYSIIKHIIKFIKRYQDDLRSLTSEDRQFFYNGLIYFTYFSIEYTPDAETFYQQLFTHLDESILSFHELYKQQE